MVFGFSSRLHVENGIHREKTRKTLPLSVSDPSRPAESVCRENRTRSSGETICAARQSERFTSAITSPCCRVNQRKSRDHGKWYPVVVTAGFDWNYGVRAAVVYGLSWRRATVNTVCGAVTTRRRVLLPGARGLHGKHLETRETFMDIYNVLEPNLSDRFS